MELPNSFYEDEIREGFYVPAAVKQAWGVFLNVLNEVDRICKKHSIRYFADYGTLLGAVRHGGIIPWDDDFDICMLRSDYEKFCEVAPSEFLDGYKLENLRNHEEHWDFNFFLARVVAKERICFEKEHLRKYHGFPYIGSIDIFVMDNISDDPKEEDERIERAMDLIKKGEMSGSKEKCTEYYLKAEKEFMRFNDRNTTYVSEMSQFGLQKQRYFKRSMFDEVIYLPFESMEIPVPAEYLSFLSEKYFNFLEPVLDIAGHDYPFFEKQKEALLKSGVSLPQYIYKEKEREHPKENTGRRNDALQYLEYLKSISKPLLLNSEEMSFEELFEICEKCQQFAIDFGTWIEGLKGEGHVCVKPLEEYCEIIASIAGNNATNPSKLEESLEIIEKSVKENIIERNEIVFLPFKADYWNTLKPFYEEAIKDNKADVYVVPIPYFYKDYDGTLIDMQYDLSGYPKELKVISVEKFDLSIHQPDKIFYQNPYDEWNETISVHPMFYSTELQKVSPEIVYVPWFVTEDFDSTNERAISNMKYYCNMPGVINADKVYLQSETICQRYIQSLEKFTEIYNVNLKNKIETFKAPIEKEITKDEVLKIFFSVSLGKVIEEKENCIFKLESVIETFKCLSGKVKVFWNDYRWNYDVSKENEKFIKEYYNIMWKAVTEGVVIPLKESNIGREEIGAYYGSYNQDAYFYYIRGKKVMVTERL